MLLGVSRTRACKVVKSGRHVETTLSRGLFLTGNLDVWNGHLCHRTMAKIVPVDEVKAEVLSKLRTRDFKLKKHCHGKASVRVLKVRREVDVGRHEISEYTVNTVLWSDAYEKVFTQEDNSDLVATDTQKNTVYIVAKRTDASSPEQFAIDLCTHYLKEYPILSQVSAEVTEVPWRRAVVEGSVHDHGFEHPGNEQYHGLVVMTRGKAEDGSPTDNHTTVVESSIKHMVVLKTTQSGFENFHRDQYTLLPNCTERCLSTELSCTWTYTNPAAPAATGIASSFSTMRDQVRAQLQKAIFGPASGGVYSESLQATIYDGGCMVLEVVPDIQEISITTPNIHYLPCVALNQMGEKFADDIFIPTSEPAGSIKCTVSRD